jgi:MFS family permease
VSENYLRGIYLRLAGVVMLAVMLALSANAYLSHRSFERSLAPEVTKKVAGVGASMRALVLRAVESGVGFDGLYGVSERFEALRSEVNEIAYIAITDAEGRVMHQAFEPPAGGERYFRTEQVLALLQQQDDSAPAVRVGDQYIVSLPIVSYGQGLGMLHIGVNVSFVDDMVLDMLFDVLVILVVSLFFTLELLHFLAGAQIESSLRAVAEGFDRGARGDFADRPTRHDSGPFKALLGLIEGRLARINADHASLARAVEHNRLRPAHERPIGLTAVQNGLLSLAERFRFGKASDTDRSRSDQLAKIRAPLFVFILAEELTRSFLPGFIGSLEAPSDWLSPQIVIGLPIALFMLIVAVAQPYLGALCERIGHRRMMTQGAAIAAVGFFATALSQQVLDLLIWRSMCAIGYAMVFVAGQSYVLDNAAPRQRARSFAVFVGAIMAATVCGPSIGGILADNIGVRPTFVIAALLAAGSLAVIRLLPAAAAPVAGRPVARVPRLSEIVSLLGNARFMVVTALAAMPAKILLTGMCFYLIPMYVISLGSTQSMAGRILMTYAVVMVVVAPWTATLATSTARMHWLVGGGLMVSGLGGLLLLAGGGIAWLFAAVALVGLGQAMSISAQSTLVSEHCAADVARLGEGVVYGVYRLLERIGNALGPMFAAVLLMYTDFRLSQAAIGAAVFCSGALFMILMHHRNRMVLSPA